MKNLEAKSKPFPMEDVVGEVVGRLQSTYPDGVLGYYHDNDQELRDTCAVLRQVLPSVLVVPISNFAPPNRANLLSNNGYWPADIGTQIGDTFWGERALFEDMLLHNLDDYLLLQDFLFEEQAKYVRRHLPITHPDIRHDQPQTVEGGCMVPIAGGDMSVYVPQIYFDYDEVEDIFDQSKTRMLSCSPVYNGWRPSLYQAMERLHIEHPNDWTFNNRHIDVLLSGVYDRKSNSNMFFIDELLWEYLNEQETETNEQWIPK